MDFPRLRGRLPDLAASRDEPGLASLRNPTRPTRRSRRLAAPRSAFASPAPLPGMEGRDARAASLRGGGVGARPAHNGRDSRGRDLDAFACRDRRRPPVSPRPTRMGSPITRSSLTLARWREIAWLPIALSALAIAFPAGAPALLALAAAAGALFDRMIWRGLAILAAFGLCPFVSERQMLAFAALFALLEGTRSSRRGWFAGAGALGACELFYSLDLGLVVLAGGL